MRTFQENAPVFVRDYRTRPHAPTWTPATVTAVHGPRSYSVETPAGATWHRHVDQMRAAQPSNDHGEGEGIAPPTTVETTTTPERPATPVATEPQPPTPLDAPPTMNATPTAGSPPLRRSSRVRKSVNRMDL